MFINHLGLRLGNVTALPIRFPVDYRCEYHRNQCRELRSTAFLYTYRSLDARIIASAVFEQAPSSTYDVGEVKRLLLAGPPVDFDFREEVTADSRKWVDEHAPQLRDLVDDGTLVVLPRRLDYCELRTDGYCEPRVVLLVGTAHVSRRSQRDVDRVIREVIPDSVVVELCRSRSAVLSAPLDTVERPLVEAALSPRTDPQVTSPSSEYGLTRWESDIELEVGTAARSGGTATATKAITTLTTGSSNDKARTGPVSYINPLKLAGETGSGGGGGAPGEFLRAVARSVSLGGQSALLLRVLLAGLASRTAGSLGVAVGGEFAAAQAAAEAVGSQLVLGDRPVEITLSRAWEALPLIRRLQLCGELLRGALGAQRQVLNEELVERLKSDDAVTAFFTQMSASYPELVPALITERDLYLAWSMKRSKAVNGANLVVGVVGRGHLRGVVYALLRDRGGAGLRFTELVEGRNSRRRRSEQATRGLQQFVIEVALGGVAYLVWLAIMNI